MWTIIMKTDLLLLYANPPIWFVEIRIEKQNEPSAHFSATATQKEKEWPKTTKAHRFSESKLFTILGGTLPIMKLMFKCMHIFSLFFFFFFFRKYNSLVPVDMIDTYVPTIIRF